MNIVFVGQNPSYTNSDAETAFVGSRSYATLMGWLVKLGLNERQVTAINASNKVGRVTQEDVDHVGILSTLLQEDVKIVCLGKYAEESVLRVAYENKISDVDVFCLPHPSGLNRKLNNKEEVDKVLEQCRRWLNER